MGRWVHGSLLLVRTVWFEVMTKAVLLGWAVTSVIVGISGPFGTFVTRPLSWRLAYWSVLIAIAVILAVAFRVLWRAALVRRLRNAELVEDALVCASLAVVFGTGLVFVNRWLTGPDGAHVFDVPASIVVTFSIAAAVVTLRRWMQASVAVMPSPRDRLLDRIGAGDGIRLSKVSSDNHHIRILTSDGAEHRILMRLRDAVAEIDVEPGMFVHRSHWVALSEISRIEEEGGKEFVRLPGGAGVPIGPKYRPNLIEAGLLND